MEIRTVLLLSALLVTACGDDDDDATDAPPDAGVVPDGGSGGCSPGELLSDSDTCIPAGVPDDHCHDGFTPDGDGCRAILPPAACGVGEMAIVGETSCREVAPCPPEPYGAAPLEPTTEFVDANYGGADSDGSMTKPWTTILDAIVAASPDAVIAIAEGSYVGDLEVTGKSVRLWGRCPGLVEIVGTASLGTVVVREASANGTEVHDVAIRGMGNGLAISGAQNVLVERLWIHDTGGRGVDIEDALGETSVTMRASLVEQTHEVGVFVSGSELDLDASVVRDTHGVPNDVLLGAGLVVQYNPPTDRRSTGTVTRSLLERNAFQAVLARASDLTVEGTLLRDNGAEAQHGGFGVDVESSDGRRSNGVVRGCVIEQSREAGALATGSDLLLEDTTILDTHGSINDPTSGYGVSAQIDGMGNRASVVVRSCFIGSSEAIGVAGTGSDLTIESTLVRGDPSAPTGFRRGMEIGGEGPVQPRATLAMRGSVIEKVGHFGLLIDACDATIESLAVRDVDPTDQGTLGIGVVIQYGLSDERSQAELRDVLVERVRDVGVFVIGSDASLYRVVIRDVAAQANDTQGDGVAVMAEAFPATAHIDGIQIERTARSGIGNFGATVELANGILTCNPIDLDGEVFGGRPYVFTNGGNNVCGCDGSYGKCVEKTSSLTPPVPPEAQP